MTLGRWMLAAAMVTTLVAMEASGYPRPVPRRYVPVYAPPPVYVPAPPPPPRYVPSPPPPRAVVVVPAAPAPATVAVPAEAPHRTDLGVFLGVGLGGGVLAGSAGEKGISLPGGGFSLFGGIDAGRYLGFEFNWKAGMHSGENKVKTAMHAFTLDAHLYLTPQGHFFRPYINVGGGAFLMYPEIGSGRKLTGPGIDAGLGADIYFNPAVSVGAQAGWRGMFLDDAQDFGGRPHEAAFLHDVSGTVRVALHF